MDVQVCPGHGSSLRLTRFYDILMQTTVNRPPPIFQCLPLIRLTELTTRYHLISLSIDLIVCASGWVHHSGEYPKLPPPPPLLGPVSSQLAWVTLSKCNGYFSFLEQGPNLSVPPDDCRSYFSCRRWLHAPREITQVFPQHLQSVEAKLPFCLPVLSQHSYFLFTL